MSTVHTVPWDADADGEITGRTIRSVRLAAEMALEAGWTAEKLRERPRWNEPTITGALVRTAVRWGLIP